MGMAPTFSIFINLASRVAASCGVQQVGFAVMTSLQVFIKFPFRKDSNWGSSKQPAGGPRRAPGHAEPAPTRPRALQNCGGRGPDSRETLHRWAVLALARSR